MLVGRLQIFNNWSPYMVADPSKIWIGLEYFCYETDDLWKMADEEMNEIRHRRGGEDRNHLRAATCAMHTWCGCPRPIRPISAPTTDSMIIREFLDRFENLFLVGRNGMHKYNNQDHSMLTAMTAVDNIIAGVQDKGNVWSINTEMEYHEEEAKDEARTSGSPTKNTDSVGAAV